MKTKLTTPLTIATIVSLLICLLVSGVIPIHRSANRQAVPQWERQREPAPQTKPATATKPLVQVCFVLDTTGSMGGLIEGAKIKIWSIANEFFDAKPQPELHFALIGYRDRGDDYITKRTDMTRDLDAIYANLMAFEADGGGDGPESVNQALYEAVHSTTWSSQPGVLKMIFLVGDCPPHMDYDEPQYPQIAKEAAEKGILINTIQCGNDSTTTPIWTAIAQAADGSFAAIDQTGGMIAINSPMDDKLAELNAKLGDTIIAYGSFEQQTETLAKQELAESSSREAMAYRLKANALQNNRVLSGQGDLVDDLKDKTVSLEKVDVSQLPAELQSLSAAELVAHIQQKEAQRETLRKEILEVSKQRDEWIRKESKTSQDGFDAKVAQIIAEQAARKGIQLNP